MIVRKLHENWTMRTAGKGDYLPAIVPGSVYNDLLINGKMEDPYYRDNEMKALPLMEEDYEYRTFFSVENDLLDKEEVFLHFDGLDTLASIYLNETKIGDADNMHRIWEYPVKKLLKPDENQLRIIFASPTKYLAAQYAERKIEGSSDAMEGFPMLRKAHCMFGWDWGPRLPDAGIWRDVELLGVDDARFESVYITQDHKDGAVSLALRIDIKRLKAKYTSRFGKDADETTEAGYTYTVTIVDPDGNETKVNEAPETINIENPQLWWPNGYGDQPLYKVKVELCKDGAVLDIWENRIGLRTMTMHLENDQYGTSFAHKVNGVQIFAMGADYIPEDNILSRVTPERTYDLLKQCKDANFNAVRVWGGGNYPYDAFWDACDELGLMVWEDFMFACAVYDLTPDFEENIRAEFIDNIRRIRHHASLGLWCGNNEMEMFMNTGLWNPTPKLKSDYIKMYEYILPSVLKEHDPQTFYWPASPSSGGGFDDPNGEDRGDVHYWDVWHGNKPFPEYRKFYFRYLSEFGFQSFPALKTVETFTEPEDRNVFSYVMEKHQRNESANGKIMNYLEQNYLYPTNFDTLLYASQLLQADAIRYGVEHFRRHRGRCMGAIYWQLNDCWPVASWASIDYCGRWKALHYYAKRFFAPVMISCKEEGLLTQNTNVNAQLFALKKSIQLSVANETMEDKKVLVKWALRNGKAEVLKEDVKEILVEKLSSKWLEEVELPEAELYGDYVSYEAVLDGEVVSGGTVMFSMPKHFKMVNPNLRVRVEGDDLVVTAESYARSVEIINDADDMLLSDNYFDMNGGERRVKVLKGKAEGLKIRSVYDIR